MKWNKKKNMKNNKIEKYKIYRRRVTITKKISRVRRREEKDQKEEEQNKKEE